MTQISSFIAKYSAPSFSEKKAKIGSSQSIAIDILQFAKYHILDLRKEFCGSEGAARYSCFQSNLQTLAQDCDEKTQKKITAILEKVRPSQFNPLSPSQMALKEQKKTARDPLFGIHLLYQLVVEKTMCEAPMAAVSTEAKQGTPEILADIENVVISGGGAKGAQLPGAFRELFKKAPQFMNQINGVAGSSVGAITAAMLATGVSRETMLEIGGVDIEALLGKELVGKTGETLIYFIRQCIRINILLRLSEMDVEKKEKFKNTNPEMAEKIKQELLRPQVQDSEITFEMLAYLRKIDPDHFKELHVTATETSGSLLVFNSENTPSTDIAHACRASASIPVVFEPVQMKIGDENKTLYDGAVINNVPVKIFEDKGCSPRKTMVFVFEKPIAAEGKSIFDTGRSGDPYKPSTTSNLLKGPVLRAVTGIDLKTPSSVLKAQILHNVKENYPHIVALSSDLSTISFKRASKSVREYSRIGKLAMKAFLEQLSVSPSDSLPRKVSAAQKENIAKSSSGMSFKEKCFSVFKEAMSALVKSFSFLTFDIPLFLLF